MAKIREETERKENNQTKGQFFERINKIDKPLTSSSRRKQRTQINKEEMKQETNNQPCRNTKGHENTINNFMSTKFNNPEENDKYLETYSLPN